MVGRAAPSRDFYSEHLEASSIFLYIIIKQINLSFSMKSWKHFINLSNSFLRRP